MLKHIKKFLIIISIIIVLICVAVVLLKKNGRKNSEELKQSQDISDLNDETFLEISSYDLYYSVKGIIEEYIMHIKQINGDEQLSVDRINQPKEEIYKIEKEEGTKSIYKTFDNKYIEECNITEKDIISLAETIKKDGNYNQEVFYDTEIKNMHMATISTDIVIALVNLEINNIPINFIVKLDYINNTYSIFGEEYVQKFKYNKNTKLSEINIDENEIQKNDYNEFIEIHASNEYIIDQYFSEYKEKILNNSEKAYELLEKEYREKRFNSYEEYTKYIQKNYEEFEQSTLSKYQINSNNEYTQYVCLDQNYNYYIFTEKSFLDYSVTLDTYTILTEKFKDTYDSAEDKIKVRMNIDKWIKMLNNRDYSAAYKVLDETFRNENFDTEEKFEEYMREKYPFHYNLIYNNFSEENGIYVQDIKLESIGEDEETEEEISVIMQLKDDYNFVMSFGIE